MGWRLSSVGKWLLGAAGKTKVCDCCEEGVYLLACPCFIATTEPPTLEECGTTEEPCIAIDVRTELDDEAGQLWQRWHEIWAAWLALEPFVVKVGDYCYRLTPFFVADPGVSEETRAAFLADVGAPDEFLPTDIITGTVTYGGKGSELDRVDDCTEDSGCVAFSAGGEWIECFGCDPDGPLSNRTFVCAANQGFVLPDLCACIDHAIRFTDDAVNTIELGEVVTRYLTLEYATWWQFDLTLQEFYCAPAPCCYCLAGLGYEGGGGEGYDLCVGGREWHNIDTTTLWAAEDVCCGKAETLRYSLSLTYRSEREYTDGGNTFYSLDEVQDVTVTDRTGGGSTFSFNIRQLRKTNGVETSDELTPSGDLEWGPRCCLLGDSGRLVPWPGAFTDHSEVADGPGTPGSERCVDQRWQEYSGDFDDPDQLRDAWDASPWAFLQILSDALDGDRTTTGTYNSYSCSHARFRLQETYYDAGLLDTRTVDIDLEIHVLYDLSQPCVASGGCSEDGWGTGSAWEYLP